MQAYYYTLCTFVTYLYIHVCVCVWAQSCLTSCDPMDYSPPGSSAHESLQSRLLEWLPFPCRGDLPDPEFKPESYVSCGGRRFLYHDTRLPWWLRQQSVCLQRGRPRFDPWLGKILWRKKWQPTPVHSRRSHGQRSLVCYRLSFSFSCATWDVLCMHMYR